MLIQRLAKRITVALALLLLLAGGSAVLAWKFVQHRIARNARAPQLVQSREPAVDFPFRTLDGNTKHLSEMRGNVVFLNLWGTWCIQCVAEMPTIQALYDHYRNDPAVTFAIVSRLDSPETVRRYARRNHFDLPFYTTEDADIPSSMQLNQFPATFIYAPDGDLMVKHTGAADWSAASVISFSLDYSKEDWEQLTSIGAAVKEMEAAGISWVTHLHSVPFIALKAITDIVDGDRPAQEEVLENLHAAAKALQVRLPACPGILPAAHIPPDM